jgi:hypothetical protein
MHRARPREPPVLALHLVRVRVRVRVRDRVRFRVIGARA